MPSPYRTLRVALVLLVAGIALFNSAKWVMLSGDSAVAMGVTYTSRFTGVAAYFIIAILFRTHLPSMKNILTVLGIFAGLYVVSTILVLFTGTGEFNNVISYATAVLYGIATALFFLLYAHAFSTQGPKKSAVLFAVAQLVTNCFMMLFSIIEPQALIVTRLVFLVIGPVLLIISIMMLLKVSDRVEAAAAEKHDVKASKASKGVSAKPAKTADAADAAETAPESGDVVPLQYPGEDDAPLTESELSPETLATTRFPRKPLDWALLISAGFVFSTVFGIIAQLSSSPGSSFGLYDSGTGIVLIMVDLLLVLFMYYVGESFTFATALLIIVAVVVQQHIAGGNNEYVAGGLAHLALQRE